MPFLSDLASEAQIAARSLVDYATGGSLRLGVTGLSRAGKSVFITAFVHALVSGARLPVFRAQAEGRLIRATLEPQPDDAVPRFAYEDHLASLIGPGRSWPESTRRISQLRLTLEFERASGWKKGPSQLTVDIVDYPGEWLLDLPLLTKSYAQWAREAIEQARLPARLPAAGDWLAFAGGLDPAAPAIEDDARRAADLFTRYLRDCRNEVAAQSTLPPGRFLLPGDLEGSPALTFAPLPDVPEDAPWGSLAAMMARRYEAYKARIVRPFFLDHFVRLDRQIVLVDALAALNAGPAAVRDLETALTGVLGAFRAGRSGALATIFRPRVSKILFAATKADHLHHTSHDRLEAILRHLTGRAIARAENLGASIDVIALAAVRATREARVRSDGTALDAIIGTPIAGERMGGEIFDGQTELAIYPGELPTDPAAIFRGEATPAPSDDMRFIRFRPPHVGAGTPDRPAPLPHIRLDRAVQFLIGDKL